MNLDFTVEFEEIDNRLDAYFVEQSSDTLPPLPYEKNKKLFSFIKRDNINLLILPLLFGFLLS